MWHIKTAFSHYELEYFFFFGSIFCPEAAPPAEKDQVTFNL